jgi:opacity protein-like surface antigen
MKKLLMFTVCALCAANAAVAEDGEKDKGANRGGVYFGMATPINFSEYFNPGYFGGISERDEVRTDGTIDYDIGADIEFGTFSLKKNEDYWLGMFGVDIFSRFYPAAFRVPYLSASAGFVAFFGEYAELYALKLSAGGGVNIPLGSVSLALDVKYTLAVNFGGSNTYWPVRLELIVPFSIFDIIAKD